MAGRIVGMPTHLRCVHVDDSKLGLGDLWRPVETCDSNDAPQIMELDEFLRPKRHLFVSTASWRFLESFKVGTWEHLVKCPVWMECRVARFGVRDGTTWQVR